MNQNPKQLAHDAIGCMLHAAGWQVQFEQKINSAAVTGVTIRECGTDIGPADYALSVDKKPRSIIKRKWLEGMYCNIYNLWKEVMDHFDVFQVGLTATPDNRTFGYFDQNVLSDYGYEEAVVDGVLVLYNICLPLKRRLRKKAA